MHEKNSYSQAINAYGSTQAELSPRDLESRLLLKAASQIEMLATRMRNGEAPANAEIHDVLEYNQKLWTVFVGDTMDNDHPLPQSIKNNIASLGVFIFNRTKDLMIEAAPEKMKVLIDINRNIASGLSKQQQNAQAAAQATAAGKPPVTPPAAAPGAKVDTDQMA